jgi:ethanolamine ammonia-lyase small subunit
MAECAAGAVACDMAIELRSFTPARVGIGRTGHSVPTAELLRFQLDHARARDAVYEELDPASLPEPHGLLHSAARNRAEYLRRPDLGRKLSDGSELTRGEYDAAVVMADGLSAKAVHRHAGPVWDALQSRLTGWRLAPLTVVLQGRVAVGDEIGEKLGAKLVVVMIGERPGLTSPDSLGIYVTWEPRVGRTDAERNCVSNVRVEGVSYEAAAETVAWLMESARVKQVTGVGLKDEKTLQPPMNADKRR